MSFLIFGDIFFGALLSLEYPFSSWSFFTRILFYCKNAATAYQTAKLFLSRLPRPPFSSSSGCSRYGPVVWQARGSQVAAGKVFLESSKKRPSYLPLRRQFIIFHLPSHPSSSPRPSAQKVILCISPAVLCKMEQFLWAASLHAGRTIEAPLGPGKHLP